MADPLMDQFYLDLDPQGCRLIKLPHRIWVFGGPCRRNPSDPFESTRDAFLDRTLTAYPSAGWFGDIDKPENYPDWIHFSGYSDLLEFERDACYLSRAIILFAESPGSIAELGALVLDGNISEYLYVVVASIYQKDDYRNSFINLGPLKRVDDAGALCVVNASKASVFGDDDFVTIKDDFSAWLPRQAASAKLDPNNPMHALLLIADFVDLQLVATKDQILKFVGYFEVEIGKATLEKYLSLLCFFRYIDVERRGGGQYFYVRRRDSNAPWMEYEAITGVKRFDRLRHKSGRQQAISESPRVKNILGGGA